MRALLLAGVVVIWGLGTAHAAATLDQSYQVSDGTSEGFSDPSTEFRRAETFTVGIAGILSQVDVDYVDTPIFAGFNILATSNQTPTTTVLATGSLDSQSAGVAVFDVALPVFVGEVLAIEPVVSNEDLGSWAATSSGTYAGGQDFFANPAYGYPDFTSNTGPSGSPSADDFQTFVTGPDSIAVPEPASLTLLGMGVAGMAAVRRRWARR